MRYRVDVSYDGSEFHGWQVQPELRTVQGEIEETLSRILGVRIRIMGSGRTDAGVHALHQVFHFDFPRELDLERLVLSLNRTLPEDIVVLRAEKVDEGFHARFSVKSKTYIYVIDRGEKTPFLSRYTWNYPYPLDVDLMKKAASMLVGDINCKAFVTSMREVEEKNPVRTFYYSAFHERGRFLFYVIRGISFLRYLVRGIVGTLVRLGKGEVTEEEFKRMLRGGFRKEPIYLAPPQGLYLARVEY